MQQVYNLMMVYFLYLLCGANFRKMKRIYRHKAITEKGDTFRQFSTKAEIEEYIQSQIESRGLD